LTEDFHKQEALRCLKVAMEKFEIFMSEARPELREFCLELARDKASELGSLIKSFRQLVSK
jgi:hypothetical protein